MKSVSRKSQCGRKQCDYLCKDLLVHQVGTNPEAYPTCCPGYRSEPVTYFKEITPAIGIPLRVGKTIMIQKPVFIIISVCVGHLCADTALVTGDW